MTHREKTVLVLGATPDEAERMSDSFAGEGYSVRTLAFSEFAQKKRAIDTFIDRILPIQPELAIVSSELFQKQQAEGESQEGILDHAQELSVYFATVLLYNELEVVWVGPDSVVAAVQKQNDEGSYLPASSSPQERQAKVRELLDLR